tara:strand:- start:1790 stop:2770 length:981 start_codon:yes stop_codon:yes gene_type:complete
MSKIALITGITGQDGSYLAELLLAKNYEVHGIVRPDFSKDDKLKNWRIKKIYRDIILHKESIENYEGLTLLIKKIMPNEVYHLAAQANDGYSFDNEFYTFRINLNATHYIVSAVRKINDKIKFFFAGSSEMFGDVKSIPINEKTLFNPKSAYGIAKVTSHHIIKNYRENFKMHASTGILFNHESPRKDIRFVGRKISYSVAKIKKGMQKRLELGTLKSKRDWGHAKDYVKAMWLMSQQKNAEDFIIGSGKLHTVEDFAEIAFDHVGLNYKDFIYLNKNFVRPVKPVSRVADITKAKKILKWKPKFSFKELVVDMVEADLKLITNNL